MEATQICAVCRIPNTETHFGINVCRACAVFYRRAHGKKQFLCRGGSEACTLDRNVRIMCKLCRYKKMHNIINSISSSPSSSSQASIASRTSNESTECSPPISNGSMEYFSSSNKRISQPVSVMREEIGPMRTTGVILTRIRTAYNDFCNARQERELEGVIYDKTTFVAVPIVHREIMNASLHCSAAFICSTLNDLSFDFASEAFSEFNAISPEYQNALLINFGKTFREFEGAYRSLKYFGKCCKHFFGFTKYIDFTDMDRFLADSPHKEFLKDIFRKNGDVESMMDWIPVMDKVNFSSEEFIAGVGILFWNIDGKSVDDELIEIASKQRSAIFSELHSFYRNDLHVEEYSSRIGELFMLISTIERSLRTKFHVFEMFKLMDLMDDESLRLAKLTLD